MSVFLTSIYCAFPLFNRDSDLFLKRQVAVTTCMIASLCYFIVSQEEGTFYVVW